LLQAVSESWLRNTRADFEPVQQFVEIGVSVIIKLLRVTCDHCGEQQPAGAGGRLEVQIVIA
jgi:hypothetical protein